MRTEILQNMFSKTQQNEAKKSMQKIGKFPNT